jgi:hypothetical protein
MGTGNHKKRGRQRHKNWNAIVFRLLKKKRREKREGKVKVKVKVTGKIKPSRS